MKKLLISLILFLQFAAAFSQKVKISEMPVLPGHGLGAYLPVVYNGTNYRISVDSIASAIARGGGIDSFKVYMDGTICIWAGGSPLCVELSKFFTSATMNWDFTKIIFYNFLGNKLDSLDLHYSPLQGIDGITITPTVIGGRNGYTIGFSGLGPDVNVRFAVLDSINTPVVSPGAGDPYLVGTVPTGVFVGHAKQIATWNGSSYDFVDADPGDLLFIVSNGFTDKWDGTNWIRQGKLFIVNNGNKGVPIRIGTADAQTLSLMTNGVNRIGIGNSGSMTFQLGVGTGVGYPVFSSTGVMTRVNAGGLITAKRGLNAVGNEIRMGGSFDSAVIITTGAFPFQISGGNASVSTLQIDNAVTGSNARAIQGNGPTGVGVEGNTNSGIAGRFTAFSSGTALIAQAGTGSGIFASSGSSTLPAIQANIGGTATNTIQTGILVQKTVGGTAAAGIGVSIDFGVQASGSTDVAGSIYSKWTDATTGTRTSEVGITGVNNATTENWLKMKPGGLLIINNGADTVASRAYARSVGGAGAGGLYGGSGSLSGPTDVTMGSNPLSFTTATGSILYNDVPGQLFMSESDGISHWSSEHTAISGFQNRWQEKIDNGTNFLTFTADADANTYTIGGAKVILNNVPVFADNATAITGGLAVGTVYRTGDNLKIVH